MEKIKVFVQLNDDEPRYLRHDNSLTICWGNPPMDKSICGADDLYDLGYTVDQVKNGKITLIIGDVRIKFKG